MWPAAINYKLPEMQKQGYSEISWENLLYVPLAHTESPSPPLNLVGVQMKNKYLWLSSWNRLFHFWAVLMPLPCCFRWTWPKLFEILWSICFSFFKLKLKCSKPHWGQKKTKKKTLGSFKTTLLYFGSREIVYMRRQKRELHVQNKYNTRIMFTLS